MKKKITLEEHIKRLNQLSKYNKSIGKYQFLNEDAPMQVNGQTQTAAPQAQNNQQGNQLDAQVDQELDKLFDNPAFSQQMQGAIAQVTQALPADLQKIATTTGDKDGELDIQESAQLQESGLILAASMALAAPKIAEYIGKGLSKAGIKVNSKIVQKMGDKMSHFGHAIHDKYIKGIEFALKPLTKNLDDQKRHAVAETILTMMVAGLGVASIYGAIHAIQAGHAGIAALETGLSGVKSAELAEKIRELLPAALLAVGVETMGNNNQQAPAQQVQGSQAPTSQAAPSSTPQAATGQGQSSNPASPQPQSTL